MSYRIADLDHFGVIRVTLFHTQYPERVNGWVGIQHKHFSRAGQSGQGNQPCPPLLLA
jgi:hypothetical protein